jgi:hypothetical protein
VKIVAELAGGAAADAENAVESLQIGVEALRAADEVVDTAQMVVVEANLLEAVDVADAAVAAPAKVVGTPEGDLNDQKKRPSKHHTFETSLFRKEPTSAVHPTHSNSKD